MPVTCQKQAQSTDLQPGTTAIKLETRAIASSPGGGRTGRTGRDRGNRGLVIFTGRGGPQ